MSILFWSLAIILTPSALAFAWMRADELLAGEPSSLDTPPATLTASERISPRLPWEA